MPSFATLPFAEQLAFFRGKVNLPTNAWNDIEADAHDHAFVVAGATKMDVLEDFRTAVDRAISEGRTLGDFRKDFDNIVARHGWSYKGLPGWRAKVIYETNVRQTYNAGREAQFADPEFRRRMPYLQYRHSGAERFRPLHKSWDGKVLRADDPWWDTHSPMNGYGCKCKKFAIGPDELRLLGKDGPDATPNDGTYEYTDRDTGEVTELPMGVDPGFQHRPGAAWLKRMTPEQLDGWPSQIPSIPAKLAGDAMPTPRRFPADSLLPPGLADEAYVDAFLGEFGAAIGKPVVHTDVTGEPLLINEELFKKRKNGNWKVQKAGREAYLPMLAISIQEPDEVWAKLEWHGVLQRFVLRRRYIAQWAVGEGEQAGISVFDWGPDGWLGVTSHVRDEGATMEDLLRRNRQGVRLYRRQEGSDE